MKNTSITVGRRKSFPRPKLTREDVEFMRLVNEYRRSKGLQPLLINPRLQLSALRHSYFMRATGRIGHVVEGHPDGRTPPQRVQKLGYRGRVGENVLEFANGFDPQGAFRAWLGSPPHHATLLQPQWRVMGIGNMNTHWTHLFGDRVDGTEYNTKAGF